MLYVACKSGKDRTGLVDKHNSLRAIQHHLEDITPEELKKAYETYNNAMHNEFLAAGNGGSRGSFGLKAKTSYMFMPSKNILQFVKEDTINCTDCADLNAAKASKDSTHYPTQVRTERSIGTRYV